MSDLTVPVVFREEMGRGKRGKGKELRFYLDRQLQ
jgi:hypothetical protein